MPYESLFTRLLKSAKRTLARPVLDAVYSTHFIRRRALSRLHRHFVRGELELRYRLPDHVLRLDPADDVITPRVLLRGNWQRGDLERAVALLRAHVPQSAGKAFVDAGANIGTETVYAMLSGHFSRAVSIEPEPRNFAYLTENIAANGLQSRVHAEMVAVGEKAETLMLMRNRWNKGGHAIAGVQVTGESDEGLPVSVLPLPVILERAGIAAQDVGLVWMDVNGAEGAVLRGMPELLRLRVPIVLEHLPELVSREAAREVLGILKPRYPFFCPIEIAGAKPRPLGQFDPFRSTGDFLFF